MTYIPRSPSELIKLLLTIVFVFCSSAFARADDLTTFGFSSSAPGLSVSGTLYTKNKTVYEVLGIQGAFSSVAAGSGPIVALVPSNFSVSAPTVDVNATFDNLLFTSPFKITCAGIRTNGLLDACGLDFLVNTGGPVQLEVNIYAAAGGGYLLNDALVGTGAYLDNNVPVTFAIATTPEPSSLALLSTGILGVIGAAKRRFV